MIRNCAATGVTYSVLDLPNKEAEIPYQSNKAYFSHKFFNLSVIRLVEEQSVYPLERENPIREWCLVTSIVIKTIQEDSRKIR